MNSSFKYRKNNNRVTRCQLYTYDKRHGQCSKPPSYYLDYGYHFCESFSKLKPYLSKEGQNWVDKTMVELQRFVEKKVHKNDDLELDDNRFTDYAFDTHPDAYKNGGIYGLGISSAGLHDLALITKLVMMDRRSYDNVSGTLKQAATVAKDAPVKAYNTIIIYNIYKMYKR